MANPMESRAEEFQQLQREYRHMELNRKAYADESHQLLRKQQQSIAKLRRENDALKSQMTLELRQKTKPLSDAQNEKVAKLQDEADAYADAVDREKSSAAVLQDQIKRLRREILRKRKEMGGVHAARDNQVMVQKQMSILENRLDKALVKFNEVLASNKALRQRIDHLRRERVVFDDIYRKLEKELSEKKRQMASVIEISNLSYEQRDAFQMEIAAIEQANRKEQLDFKEQIAELDLAIDSLILADPMHRSRRRLRNSSSVGELGRNASRGSTQQGSPGAGPASLSLEEEAKIKAEVEQWNRQLEQDRAEVETSEKRVQNFEEAFNKIRAATGIQDVEELVRTFIKNEDQNFSLFNYVNEQTNDLEKLEEEIQQLREEETRHAQESGEDANQHKALLDELDARLASTKEAVEKYEKRCVGAQSTLDRLKSAIERCFKSIECSPETVADASVTDTNMMSFLGTCEQRTYDLLQAYAFVQRRERERQTKLAEGDAREDAGYDKEVAERRLQESRTGVMHMLCAGPSTPMGHDLIHVNPPKLEDCNDVDIDGDDEEERPLTREELKARTRHVVPKRAARPVPRKR
eukprot:scaffold2923_cov313-Pinguiococcus_pyrenoidosus.AAC.11